MRTQGIYSRTCSILIGLILAMLFGLATSGCGNPYAKPYRLKLESMELVGVDPDSGAGDSDPKYACPKESNVKPDWEWSLDGSGYYTVCPSRTVYADILVHGHTSLSNRICIFPVEYVDDRNIFTKPDLATGGPMHVCVNTADRGVYATFAGVKYNGAFIVEAPFRDQMYACLVQKQAGLCPRYSFGIFR